MAESLGLSPQQLNVLKAIQLLCARDTARDLAGVFAEKVEFEVLDTEVVPLSLIPRLVRAEERVHALAFHIGGDALGHYLVLVLESHRKPLLEMMAGVPLETLPDEQRRAMFKELGNLLCAGNFNHLVKYTPIRLAPSSPLRVEEAMGDVLNFLVAGARAWQGEIAAATILRIRGPGAQAECILFLIPGRKMVELLVK
ncbi:MAG: hypothetical protein HY558_08275 [Euryarchaeota archaeon]|nr:hypothetical protein [Euryarchaeota archaeon]